MGLNSIKGGSRLTRTEWADPYLTVFVSDRGNIVTQKGQGSLVLYVPTQADLFARDWEIMRQL